MRRLCRELRFSDRRFRIGKSRWIAGPGSPGLARAGPGGREAHLMMNARGAGLLADLLAALELLVTAIEAVPLDTSSFQGT